MPAYKIYRADVDNKYKKGVTAGNTLLQRGLKGKSLFSPALVYFGKRRIMEAGEERNKAYDAIRNQEERKDEENRRFKEEGRAMQQERLGFAREDRGFKLRQEDRAVKSDYRAQQDFERRQAENKFIDPVKTGEFVLPVNESSATVPPSRQSPPTPESAPSIKGVPGQAEFDSPVKRKKPVISGAWLSNVNPENGEILKQMGDNLMALKNEMSAFASRPYKQKNKKQRNAALKQFNRDIGKAKVDIKKFYSGAKGRLETKNKAEERYNRTIERQDKADERQKEIDLRTAKDRLYKKNRQSKKDAESRKFKAEGRADKVRVKDEKRSKEINKLEDNERQLRAVRSDILSKMAKEEIRYGETVKDANTGVKDFFFPDKGAIKQADEDYKSYGSELQKLDSELFKIKKELSRLKNNGEKPALSPEEIEPGIPSLTREDALAELRRRGLLQ